MMQKNADIVKLKGNQLTGNHSNIFEILNSDISKKTEINHNNCINILLRIPSFKQFYESIPKFTKRFEVVFPKDVYDKICNKEYEFISTLNENEYFAFLRDKNTKKIIKHLKIKELSEIENLPQNLQSLSNVAIMQMLNQISLQLKSIEEKIILIQKEFNNDRIGKLQAGHNLYLDSKQMINPENKRLALINSVSLFIEGRAQLSESLKSRLENTEVGFWNTFYKEVTTINNKKFQEENIKELLKEFFFIQRSSQLILLVYLELEELNAAMQSIAPIFEILEHINKEEEIHKIIEWDKSKNDWKLSFKGILDQFYKLEEYNEIENKNEIIIEIKK